MPKKSLISKQAVFKIQLWRVVKTACAILLLGFSPAHSGDVQLLPYSSEDLDSIDPNLKTGLNSNESKGSKKADKLVSSDEMRVAKFQILLDRQGLSPGAIDGQVSDYFNRILARYQGDGESSLLADSGFDIDAKLKAKGGNAFQTYELSAKDIAGPFEPQIPSRIQDQAELKHLSYRNVVEAIAEKFHMDEIFLKRLNRGIDFTKPGSQIKVANIGRYLDRWVGRIRADKKLRQVTAYDTKGEVLAIYPASIGSLETPSPSGVFTVKNKASFPTYTLAAENGFEPVDDGKSVLIASGPNNPVGAAWIGLSKKTYGIHGTAEPENIGRSESHGCIRLTNWDALELTRLVKRGVEVVIN